MNILSFNFFSIIMYGLIFLNKFTKERWKNIFFVITTLQLTLINGLRDLSIGVDSYRYARHFYRIRELNSISELIDYDLEMGFVLLNRVIGFFFNHQFVFLACALIIYSSLAFFINKYSSNILLSYYLFIAIGFFENTFNTMRQSVAISIGLIAFHFAMKKKPHFFFLVALLAVSFHISAIVIMPMYFLVNYKLNFNKLSLIIGFYLFLLIFRYEIGRIFTLIYYGDRAGAFLEIYSMSPGIGGTALTLILMFILFTFMHTPVNNNKDKLLNATYNINIISIFIQTLSSFSYMFTRLNFFYLIYLIIYIPKLFDKSEETLLQNYGNLLKIIKPIIGIVIVLFLGYFYLDGVINNINKLLPFQVSWDYYI